MMFVSIVGHASRHTARFSGPSTMERSKRRFSPAGGGTAAGAGDAGVDEAGTVTVE